MDKNLILEAKKIIRNALKEDLDGVDLTTDSIVPKSSRSRAEFLMKDNGVIALTGQGIFTAKLILSNPKLFKYKIIWVKSKATNFLNAKKQPLRKHEDICIFYINRILQIRTSCNKSKI